MGLTQSALSKRIANLEDQASKLLFERLPKRMALTRAGRRCLEPVATNQRQTRCADEQLAATAQAGLSVLNFGAGPLFHLRYAAPVVRD